MELCLGLERRVDAGEQLDFEAILAEHPEHAARLGDYLRGGRLVDAGLAAGQDPLRAGTADVEGLDSMKALLVRLRSEGIGMQRYELGDELGRGGWGVVVAGEDPHLGRRVAIKRLSGRVLRWAGDLPMLDKPRILARFLEEAQVTSQLDHPGIVPVHELGLDGEGAPYFAMKLVKGIPLNEAIEVLHGKRPPASGSRPWTSSRALGVLERVAEALAYAHHKGVVHRDLKPHNVLVGRFGEVFLLDWGLASVVAAGLDAVELTGGWSTSVPRTVRSDPEAPAAAELLSTERGETLGTPCYLAPESLGLGLEGPGPVRASFAIDVYGLGALLYHVLAGHAPYAEPGRRLPPQAVLARIATGPPSPLREAAPGTPPALIDLCERSMAREPSRRVPSVEAWLEELRSIQAAASDVAPTVLHPDPVPERASPLRWIPWALLAFGLGLWAGRATIL